MEIRLYRHEDLALLPPRPEEIDAAQQERELAYISQLRLQNPAFTLWRHDGEPIGAAGVIIFAPGVGEAWLRGSTRLPAHGISVALTVRRRFVKLARLYQLRRIQAIVQENNDVARAFNDWLGMKYEGTLRKLGPKGEDMLMMAWVSEGG